MKPFKPFKASISMPPILFKLGAAVGEWIYPDPINTESCTYFICDCCGIKAGRYIKKIDDDRNCYLTVELTRRSFRVLDGIVSGVWMCDSCWEGAKNGKLDKYKELSTLTVAQLREIGHNCITDEEFSGAFRFTKINNLESEKDEWNRKATINNALMEISNGISRVRKASTILSDFIYQERASRD